MIWLTLFIPIFAIIALLNNRKVVLWEHLILFGVPAIAIIISYFVALSTLIVDNEYWNGYVTSATYYQSWQEWDHQTCYRSCNCHQVCTGSGDDRRCHEVCSQCPYDCSHCDDHAERWEASDNLGSSWNITPATFETWAAIWGNRVFVELNRHINYHNGVFQTCGRDGDAFRTTFVGDSTKIIPVVLEKHYANKAQTTFKPVDTAKIQEYELFNYPVYDRFRYNPVLGLNDAKVSRNLAIWNAKLGKIKQVHMLLLVFHNQSIEAAKYQEQFWKGGNKNEFILAVNIDKACDWDSTLPGISCRDTIQWAKVISWTDQRGLKTQVENAVLRMCFDKDIDYIAIIDTMAQKVQSQFIRKNWHAFDAIKVQPSHKAIIITMILTVFITASVAAFILFNDVERS
jgi:hypothetical protein